MNKLPTKQIYLLVIIIVGIIALSVYSTYAIFTFEGETSNIVSLYTPNSLKISEEMYEYKQIVIPENSYITTDIDIYNTYDYEICYSIWYQVVDGEIDKSKVKIYQINNQSSGVLASVNSIRIGIMITNDNDEEVVVKIGLASTENEGTCQLNISKDKLLITGNIDNYQELAKLRENSESKTEEAGYLIYKNQEEKIDLADYEKIYIASEYKYENEVFSLVNPIEIDIVEIDKYQSTNDKKYYTCLGDRECTFLYKINEIEKEVVTDNIDKYVYRIVNYDMMKGYLETVSGIKKVKIDNYDNYLYYGDNPNNYIYYNCSNELDMSTCELWRIIGFYYNQEEDKYLTKIIRDREIGSYQFSDNNSNDWDKASLNKYLNEEYQINNKEYLYEIEYKQKVLNSLNIKIDEIEEIDNNIKSRLLMIELADYLRGASCVSKMINEYSSDCFTNNWLNNNNGTYYTMSAKMNEIVDTDNIEEVINNQVLTVSDTIEMISVDSKLLVRPVGYLKPRILMVGGDGTLDNPYIIK